MATQPRITERPNALTADIDTASPLGALRLLRQSDAQLFAGFGQWAGLYDEPTLASVARLAAAVCEAAAHEAGLVVVTGAGTSGRLAFVVSRAFNRALAAAGRPPVFDYLIAGGDKALLRPQEGCEDDAALAVGDLDRLVAARGAARVVVVGVTCGFSATYVGAQLEAAAARPGFTAALLGFTPLELVQERRIAGWDSTFKALTDALAADAAAIVINPVVGPEAITGSTRMKGGSATKMLLEAAFAEGLGLGSAGSAGSVADRLRAYEPAVRAAYLAAPALAAVAERCGDALLSDGGRVLVLGEDTAGLLAVVDASECPPTFGASFDDVQGFVEGGWPALGNRDGELGAGYEISAAHFAGLALTPDDVVLRVGLSDAGAWMGLGAGASEATAEVRVALPGAAAAVRELALKLCLNAVSTVAHVRKGTVFGNRMINLSVSNVKLYYRSVGIVRDLSRVAEHTAEQCLLRAIYKAEQPDVDGVDVRQRVTDAASQRRVVPLALLLALQPELTVAEAQARLAEVPVLRDLLGSS